MSKQDFESIKPQLEAIPWKEVKTPKMPVGTLLQEAFDLYEWAKDDEQALLRAGLDKDLLHELPVRARALRYIQSQWSKVMAGGAETRHKWKVAQQQAIALRKELVNTLRFACRHDDGVLSAIKRVKKGTGPADLLQDLRDLAVVAESNREALQRIGYNMDQVRKAAQLSTSLKSVLAESNMLDGGEIKYFRNCAYNYLRVAMAEVRAVGRFIFRKDQYRLAGYQHRYYARK